MSRLLRINGINVDIDDKTAIGIDLQTYNIKSVGKTFINVSNTFSVPATSHNLSIFGVADDPQSTSTQIYDINVCDYWIDNEKIIDQAKIRVEEIQERINLFIYDKNDFWEETKKDLWPDFMDEMLVWLNTEKGLPIQSDPYISSTSTFLTSYTTSTEGVFLPFFISNGGQYLPEGQKRIISQSVTVINGPLLDATFTITSSRIINSPKVFTIPSGVSKTSIELATDFVDSCNSDADISALYIASQEEISGVLTNKYFLTSKEGLADSTLNIAITGSGAINDPFSDNVQQGIDKSTEFAERLEDPPLNGVNGGFIYNYYKNNVEEFQGGHFCIYVKTIFEFIESKYNVNLLVSGGILPGNIWDDIIAQKLYIPVRDLSIFMESGNCYFKLDRTTPFLPYKDQKDKVDKRVYDFINSFMNHMNVLKDEFFLGSEKVIRFARFDDIENAEVLDFSDRITGTPKYMPKIEGYTQNNYIKFKEIFPEGDELLNSKNLTCSNLNIDINSDLLEIDAYVPGIVDANSESISNVSDKESFKTFIFYISDTLTTYNISAFYIDVTTGFVSNLYGKLYIAELYDLNSEYNFLDEIITYPKVYEIEKWLTISDIRNFDFFKQRYVKDLNASFFVNKIKGFNPDKSNKPTTIELIKISNRTPVYPPDLNYWADGVLDGFVDGENDYWY